MEDMDVSQGHNGVAGLRFCFITTEERVVAKYSCHGRGQAGLFGIDSGGGSSLELS
jgi:hypothetical protein